MSDILILHVSDAHFETRSTDDTDFGYQPRLVKRLIKAAHTFCDERHRKPQICVFSGDLVNKGKPDEYAIAQRWLSALVKPWEGCAVFVVPGNHDVSRPNANKRALRYAGNKPDYFNEWLNDHDSGTFSHLHNFMNWHATAREPLGLGWDWSESPIAVQQQISVNGLLVNMIGLNTALLSCDNDDREQLAVDISTLNQMLDKTSSDQLNIVVGHHPVKGDWKEIPERWLAEWNDQELYTVLSQADGAHLYLHGHVHETAGNTVSRITGTTLTVFGAGAAYQGSKWPNAFAFYDIACKDKRVHPHTYKYNRTGGVWVPDGDFSFPITVELPKVPTTRKEAPSVQGSPLPVHGDVAIETYLLSRLKEWSGAQVIWLSFLAGGSNIFAPYKDHSGVSINEIHPYQDTAIDILVFSPSAISMVLEFTLSVLRDFKETCTKTVTDRISDLGLAFSMPSFAPELSAAMRHVESAFRSKFAKEVVVHTTVGYEDATLTCSVQTVQGRTRRVSIRICTAFDDLMKSIEKILYSVPIEDTEESRQAPDSVRVLYGLFEGCRAYVDGLRLQERHRGPTMRPEDSMNTPSEPAINAIQLMKAAGVPVKYLSILNDAYRLRDQAETMRGTPESRKLFLQAGQIVRRALSEAKSFLDGQSSGAKELHYWLRMELGYCLLEVNDMKFLSEASSIYTQIQEEYKDDVLSRYRYAQALRRLNRTEDAINVFMEIPPVLEGNRDNRIDQNHWVRAEMFTELALTHWRMSQKRETETEEGKKWRLADIGKAIKCAEKALDNIGEEKKIRALNDLVYYGWEERNGRFDGAPPMVMAEEEFVRRSEELIAALDKNVTKPVFPLDTLCRVLRYLGRQDEAVAVARRIVQMVRERFPPAPNRKLDNDINDTYMHAMETIAGSADEVPAHT